MGHVQGHSTSKSSRPAPPQPPWQRSSQRRPLGRAAEQPDPPPQPAPRRRRFPPLGCVCHCSPRCQPPPPRCPQQQRSHQRHCGRKPLLLLLPLPPRRSSRKRPRCPRRRGRARLQRPRCRPPARPQPAQTGRRGRTGRQAVPMKAAAAASALRRCAARAARSKSRALMPKKEQGYENEVLKTTDLQLSPPGGPSVPAERGTDWKSNSALRAPTRSAASGLLLRGPFPFPLAQNASSAASHTCRRPAARRLLLRAAVTTEHGHLGRSSGASQRRILQRTMDDLLEPETHGLGCTGARAPIPRPRARRACHCTRPCASPTPSADLRICAGAWCVAHDAPAWSAVRTVHK